MYHGCVVLAAKFCANCGQRTVGNEIAAFIHCNLTCLDYLTLTRRSQKLIPGDIEVFAHCLEDEIRCDIRVLFPYYVTCYRTCKVQGNIAVTQRSVRHK